MKSVGSMPPRAFGFGMALFPVRIKNLTIPVAYVNLIAAASLSPRSSAVALRLVLVVFPIPLPVRVYLENPAVRGGHSEGGGTVVYGDYVWPHRHPERTSTSCPK